MINPIIKTDGAMIFEFDDVVPLWMQKSGEEQMFKFGFEYGHHGVDVSDNKPYFGKLLYLKQKNHDLAKPHIVMNVLDCIRYQILESVDPQGEFLDIQRIAVNGQLNTQAPEKHIDTSNDTNLWTAVYYVNNSDGDTVFYQSLKKPDIEIYRSKFKKGKIVLFHGLFLHQAEAPSKDWRVSIGISFFWDTFLNENIKLDRS